MRAGSTSFPFRSRIRLYLPSASVWEEMYNLVLMLRISVPFLKYALRWNCDQAELSHIGLVSACLAAPQMGARSCGSAMLAWRLESALWNCGVGSPCNEALLSSCSQYDACKGY